MKIDMHKNATQIRIKGGVELMKNSKFILYDAFIALGIHGDERTLIAN